MAKRLLKTLLLPILALATALAFIACDGETAPDVKFHVTYSIGADATGTAPTETDKAFGEKFKLKSDENITAPAGKKFGGWNDGSLTYQAGDTYTMPGKNVTFTAQWDDDTPASKYTVTYKHGDAVDDGEAVADIKAANQPAGNYTVGNPSLYIYDEEEEASYLFSGWVNEKNKNDENPTVYLPGQTLTLGEDTTLEALWVEFDNQIFAAVDTSSVITLYAYPNGIGAYWYDNAQGTEEIWTFFTYTQSEGTITATPVGGTAVTGTIDEKGELTMELKVGILTYYFEPEQELPTGVPTFTFQLNGGTGTVPTLTVTQDMYSEASGKYMVPMPPNTIEPPEGKDFKRWLIDDGTDAWWPKNAGLKFPADEGVAYTVKPEWKDATVTPVVPTGTKYTGNWNTPAGQGGLSAVPSVNITEVWLDKQTNKLYYVVGGTTKEAAVATKSDELTAAMKTAYGDGAALYSVTIETLAYNLVVKADNSKLAFAGTNAEMTLYTDGEFTAESGNDDVSIDDYIGYYTGAATFKSNDYVMARITDGKIAFSEDYDFSFPDEFNITVGTANGKVTVEFTYSISSGKFSYQYFFTVVFESNTEFNISATRSLNNGTPSNYDINAQKFAKTEMRNVTYDLGIYTGDETAPAPTNVASSKTITAPAAPEWEGYRFLGWAKGNDTTPYDFATPITEDTAFVAVWQQITEVTVTFDIGTRVTGVTAPSSKTVAYNNPVSEPAALECEGWRFDGWTTNLGTSPVVQFDFATKLKKDTTLYAIWTQLYTVTFTKLDGVTGKDPDDVIIGKGDTFTFPENPYNVPDGKEFLGWRRGTADLLYAAGETFTYPQVNYVMTAVFGKKYTNAAKNGVITFRDYKPNQLHYYEPNEENPYFGFDGFYGYQEDDRGFTAIVDDYYGDLYTVCRVKLDDTDKTYTVLDGLIDMEFTAQNGTKLTFDGAGKAMLGSKQASYTATINSYGYLTGFVLVFAVDNVYNITFEKYDENSMPVLTVDITVDETLYSFGKYTVTYTYDTDVTGTVDAVSAWYGDNITLDAGSNLSRTGYTFAGWQVNGEGSVLNGSYKVTADVTLKAAWTEDNGGGGGTETSTKFADFAGAAEATAVAYGYDSNSAATTASSAINLNGSITYKIELYWGTQAGTTGYIIKRYYSTSSGTLSSNKVVVNNAANSNPVTDQNVDNIDVKFSASGYTITCHFEITNSKRVVTITVVNNNNSSDVQTVTWTEITPAA